MASAQILIETQRRSSRRVLEFDGIRGIAILLVLALHTSVTICPPGFVHDVIGMGWIGVDLFFVLSGFLITGILLDSKPFPSYFRRFYLRRVFRILPIYYAFVVLFFHAAPLLSHLTGRLVSFQYGRSGEVWYWTYLANWQDVVHQNRYLRHFWSLCIEEQFYLAWPLIVYLTPRNWLKYVCLGFAALSPMLRFAAANAGFSKYFLYTATPLRFEGLALGALLALAVRDTLVRDQVARWNRYAWPAAAVGLTTVFVSSGPDYVSRAMRTYGYTCIAVLCGAFVFQAIELAGTENHLPHFLRRPWLVDFGKYSYGLYVWHLPLAEQIRMTGEHALQRFRVPWMVLLPIMLVAGIATSYLAARVSWKLIEGPCAHLKERFSP